MKAQGSQNGTHRPFRQGPWIMRQTWHNLLFAHWPLAPETVLHLIPGGLRLDTFDGKAWVGVIPFRLSGIGLRGIPAIPPFNAFPEINVRTYVTRDGIPGVYFLSLDANNPAAMSLARSWFRLPYIRSDITCRQSGDSVHFTSQRRDPALPTARFCGTYRPTGEAANSSPGTVEHFLTERYCYYSTDRAGKLYRCDVAHDPWLLQKAEAEITDNTMALAHGITLPAVEPLLHYAAHMKTTIWPVRKLAGAGRTVAPFQPALLKSDGNI